MKKPKNNGGEPGPIGPIGPAGPMGPAGPIGPSGSKIITGLGEPDNSLTAQTNTDDFYLDITLGALWKREVANLDFTPTIIDLPGGVRWRLVASWIKKDVSRLVLGGTDNLTDKLQVQGSARINGNFGVHGVLSSKAPFLLIDNVLDFRDSGNNNFAQIGSSGSSGVNCKFVIGQDYSNIPSASLRVTSTTQGSLPVPSMTQAQADAIPAKANWLQVIVTDGANPGPRIWDGAAWKRISLI